MTEIAGGEAAALKTRIAAMEADVLHKVMHLFEEQTSGGTYLMPGEALMVAVHRNNGFRAWLPRNLQSPE